MTLEAEALLLATGMVTAPERAHITAAPAILKDLKGQLTECLDLEDPAHLYKTVLPASYGKHLAEEPDYEAWFAYLKPRIGADAALAYQLAHQNAREILMSRRTVVTIDTLLGPQVVESDPEAKEQWEFECAQVEQMRIVKDLAAGGLLEDCVAIFAACCPDTHRELVDHLNDQLNKRRARSKKWVPAEFLEMGVKTFLGLPQDADVSIEQPQPVPEPAKPGKTGGPKKSKGVDTDAMLTTAQKASK